MRYELLNLPTTEEMMRPRPGWRAARPTEIDEDLWVELAGFATAELTAPEFAFWVLTEPKRFGDALSDPQLHVAEELPAALPELFEAGLVRCGPGGYVATLPKASAI